MVARIRNKKEVDIDFNKSNNKFSFTPNLFLEKSTEKLHNLKLLITELTNLKEMACFVKVFWS